MSAARDRLVLPFIAAVNVVLTVASGLISMSADPVTTEGNLTQYFSLIPSNTFFVHFYLWNVFTFPFIDRSIVMALFNCLVILSAGRFTQRYFKSGMYTLMMFVVILTGLSIFWSQMVLFISTRYESFLYYETCGLSVISATFAVCMKYLRGDAPLQIRSVSSRLHFRDLPLLMVAVTVCAIGLQMISPMSIFSTILSTYFAWFYIRFFRLDPDTGILGSSSDVFSLRNLFWSSADSFDLPIVNGKHTQLTTLFSVICDRIYRAFRALGFFAEYHAQHYLSDSSETAEDQLESQPIVAKPVDLAESERRKELARNALELEIERRTKLLQQNRIDKTEAEI